MNLGTINFSGGEFTPKIDVRYDTERYVSGCRILDNMIPVVYGSVTKRPGTEFVSYTIDSSLILSYIMAYENNVECYENDVLVTHESTWLPEFLCYENEVLGYDSDTLSLSNYFFEPYVVCYDNDILCYENDILTLGV